MSFSPCFSARSQNVANRSSIRSSTPAKPAGVSGIFSSDGNIRISYTLFQLSALYVMAASGWKSAQLGNTRRSRIPFAASTRRSSSTLASSHRLHICVAAFDPQ